MLRAARPRLPAQPTVADAARFRWLAERIERAVAEGPVTPANDTREPEAQPGAEGEPAPETPATAAAHASPNRVTPEPEPQRPLNRAERRRLGALARRKTVPAPASGGAGRGGLAPEVEDPVGEAGASAGAGAP